MGRPVGAHDGIKPVGGYPDLTAHDGNFLAGFLDGEACFAISRHPGPRYSCSCTVSARRDDRALLEELQMLTGLGRIRDKPARAGSKPQSVWTISRKADCQRLSEVLSKYPLRGRKGLDLDYWLPAVGLWCGEDPVKRTTNRDWTASAYLAERLSSGKRFSPRIGESLSSGTSEQKLAYLVGLFTAEGHLSIYEFKPDRFRVKAVMQMRGDDLPLLQELKSITGLGVVHHYLPGGVNPVAVWDINSYVDRQRFVEILDRHPPRGRKRVEYSHWRTAALEHQSRSPVLRLSRDELIEARTYPTGQMPPPKPISGN